MQQKDNFGARVFPLNPESKHAEHLRESEDHARFFLVDMRGLDDETVRHLLPVAQEEVIAQSAIPVFVTDLLDFRVLREANVIFEFVPPIASSTALDSTKDWVARQDDVLTLIRQKWQPSGETRLGQR